MEPIPIHLRVPAEKKAEWVRQSRQEGKKLTDWIIERIEAKNLPITEALREAATLAREIEDTPLFYKNKMVADGVITIQQQYERFMSANNNATKLDAALWAREGYTLFSAGLPDTHQGTAPDERSTAWVTASQIARVFGGEELWRKRCVSELGDSNE